MDDGEYNIIQLSILTNIDRAEDAWCKQEEGSGTELQQYNTKESQDVS